MDSSFALMSDADGSSWLDCLVMDSDSSHSPSAVSTQSAMWARADSLSRSQSTPAPDVSALLPMSVDGPSPLSTGIGTGNSRSAADGDPCLSAASSLSTVPTPNNSTSSSSPTFEDSTSPSYAPRSGGGIYVDGNIDSDYAIHGPLNLVEEMQWEINGNEKLAIPKAEPVEDDSLCLEDFIEVPPSLEASEDLSLSTDKSKPSRGRPRKLTIASAAPARGKSVAKGRSKTGCLTCRKRKKKCDEAKPRCTNCEKNSIVCEGYPEKHIWKSGKQKAEEELVRDQNLLVATMQPIFVGLETAEDRIFWKHYNDHLSSVFTVEGEHTNAFKDLMVPLATKHPDVMHSILALASSHIDYDTPYGAQVLRRAKTVSVPALQSRGAFHHATAVHGLSESEDVPQVACDADDGPLARYGQIVCSILTNLAEQNRNSSQRLHYETFLSMIRDSPPRNQAFYDFVSEIVYFHILADDLLCYPFPPVKRLLPHAWIPTASVHLPRLIGVTDGLLHYLSQTTSIRNHIRARIQCGADPRVDYTSLYQASEVEGHIQDWEPEWPAGDSRERVTLLYKQMAWLYLKITICPPTSSYSPSSMPRHCDSPVLPAATTSCVSSPSPTLEAMFPSESGFNEHRRHSIAEPNMAHAPRPFLLQPAIDGHAPSQTSTDDSRSSPPPIRLPSNHEQCVGVALKECLLFLESFKPSDPAQTLLLVPCVVVGTACYSPTEQDRVRNAIRVIHGYTGLRHTAKALEVLNEVWRLMDLGDYLGAWDWQAVADSLGITHLF